MLEFKIYAFGRLFVIKFWKLRVSHKPRYFMDMPGNSSNAFVFPNWVFMQVADPHR